jgi:hypothetical protein
MLMKWRRSLIITALALAPAAACGDDAGFIEVGAGRDAEVDDAGGTQGDAATDMDAASDMDGETNMDGSAAGGDASDLDSSILDELLLPDGSVILEDGGILLPDGEVIDEEVAEMRYGTDLDVGACQVSDLDLIEADVDFADEGGFALVPSFVTGFGVAFHATTPETSCDENIKVAQLETTGALQTPVSLLSDCKTITDVALLGIADGWQLAWVDNATNSRELHTAQLAGLDEAMQIGIEGRVTLTSDNDDQELRPTLAMIGKRPFLTWITSRVEGPSGMRVDRRRVMGRFIDEDESFAIVDEAADHLPQALALTRVAMEGRSALAWVGPQSKPGVWLQPLDETGHARGTPHKLTDRVGASSSVDVAHRLDGAAVVYSIVIDDLPQVRFRRLDELGDPRDDERALISPPLRAQDASLASLGGSYAVAYRALPGDGQASPEIRLMFVSREGNVTRDSAGRPISFFVAESTLSTGRTYVEVSNDGLLMIGWLDAGEDTNRLKVARRRLDCGGGE